MERPNYDKTTKRLLNRMMTKDSRRLKDNRIAKIERDIDKDLAPVILQAMGDVKHNYNRGLEAFADIYLN